MCNALYVIRRMQGKNYFFYPLKQIKKFLAYCLISLQKLSFYRRVVRWFKVGIKIKEASDEDMRNFYRRFNLKQPRKISYNPNVTNFVAKKGDAVIGFVQLVRILETNSLYPGHWLFSLTVKTLYRGMGLGESLTKEVIVRAEKEKAQKLSLLVRQDNIKAVRLYRKLGFERKIVPHVEEKLEKEKIATGRKRILMCREL